MVYHILDNPWVAPIWETYINIPTNISKVTFSVLRKFSKKTLPYVYVKRTDTRLPRENWLHTGATESLGKCSHQKNQRN